MKTRKKRTTNTNGWMLAVELIKKYLIKPTKADALLSDLPENISSMDRRYCQFLFLGTIRHKLFIEHILNELLIKKPRIGLRAFLMIGIYEIMAMEEERVPKIIDWAVENSKIFLSLGESKLVNAVLRKSCENIKIFLKKDDTHSIEWLAIRYSHPKWLVTRWFHEFGIEITKQLLIWDQNIPSIYVRLQEERIMDGPDFKDFAIPTKWKDFYLIGSEGLKGGLDSLIKEGKAYIQDPSTRIAPELAQVMGNENVIDLCAAPGGKSFMLSKKLQGGSGQLVAVDLPGERIKRLRENLAKLRDVKYTIIEIDIMNLTSEYFESLKLPTQYDVVLLDAPCSNTGVLKRRVDAKWRLSENDISKMAKVQLELLKKASEFVKPMGRLIYSTCSIENEENIQVVNNFIKEYGNEFECIQSVTTYPWIDECDGGGAFLLQRRVS